MLTSNPYSVLPSAAHVAFPAPTKDAVTAFFHLAIQAGGKFHGEPRTRDSQTGYHSAAVIDFDGNSIEAVYRPGSSVVASEAGGPTIALLENGTAVSKANTVKSRAISKAPTAVENAAPAPTVISQKSTGSALAYGPPPAQKVDDGSKAAKTIIGTLIGAAAGAAVAYAMVKGDSQSTTSESKEGPPPQFQQQQYQQQRASDLLQLMAPPSQVSEARSQGQPVLRAIEAPPARSVYTSASAARSTTSRSVMSKNPWASTVYEATEFYQDENGRRASDGGSVFSIPEDLPLRAIEYPPPSSASKQRYPCNPSTFISSYAADKPRAGSVHSASRIKASDTQRRHSTDDGCSEHSRTVYRASSSHSVHTVKSHSHSKADAGAGAGSTASSTRLARNIPLPAGSTGTFYSAAPSQAGKSAMSARNIPLPADSYYSPTSSQAPKSHVSARHVLLPESVIDVEVDSNVTPDDSISQVGGSRSGRSSHSHHSHHSRHSKHSKASKHSSKSMYDEPVRPADSVSQVSRSSQRTVKAIGSSKVGSKVGSRRGSEVVV